MSELVVGWVLITVGLVTIGWGLALIAIGCALAITVGRMARERDAQIPREDDDDRD